MSAAVAIEPSVTEDALVSARHAGLHHVHDDRPGITRRRVGRGFRYTGTDGHAIQSAEVLQRIRSLAIPPAWTRVWICPDARGHIQATGRDAKGRKQYLYHPRWREVRDETKYERMQAFGAALPVIRRRAARDLTRPGLPREKVLATIVNLLDLTLIRVGNVEYAKKNASFGLTTLRDRHVTVRGDHLNFHFRGKSGKSHVIDVSDPRLATIVKRCQDLPGQELFHFRDETGELHPVESNHVNDYIRETAGDDFTAKDFRTWHGTLLAASALATADAAPPTKKRVTEAIVAVSQKLGNTPSVCRKSYVHPVIVSRYLRGELAEAFAKVRHAAQREAALLAILKEEAARRGGDLEGTLARSLKSVRR